MKSIGRVVLMCCVIVLAGCAGDKGKELFETAQFEEKQHNPEHARQLYGELVKKYPDSEFARQAKERLAELGKGK
jgi:outer membrane protein assembly factor BamD (BamD/ComL family)